MFCAADIDTRGHIGIKFNNITIQPKATGDLVSSFSDETTKEGISAIQFRGYCVFCNTNIPLDNNSESFKRQLLY